MKSGQRTAVVEARGSDRESAVPERQRESGEFALPRTPKSSRPSAPESQPVAPLRLLETPYCTIDLDRSTGIVRCARTERPYPTVAAVEEEAVAVERALMGVRGSRMLIDLRAVAPRFEPAFEAVLARLRKRLCKSNELTAIVVKTAVGTLQVKRYMREDSVVGEAFYTEEEAIGYLNAGPPDSSGRITAIPPTPSTRQMLRRRG